MTSRVRLGRRTAMCVAVFILAGRFASAQSAERILVMPLENVGRDSRIFWLGEGSAVLLADDLNALGAHAITREERRLAFDRLQVPPAASLTDASVIRIGQLVGASKVIVGTLQLENDVLVVRTRSIALEAGRIAHDITERGPLTDLFGIVERLARQLAPPSPRSPADIRGENPPLAAFENYIKGLLAETPETAIKYLNAAVETQPAFDQARLALWDLYEDQGEFARALGAVQPVSERSPWARRARFRAGLAQLDLKKYEDAFATFKRLADAAPDATIFNNLGVVQLRRGSPQQSGLPTSYFHEATEADPNDPDYFFNLGYASWASRDTQAAIYWLREAVRRNPADGDAHYVLGAALSAAGNTTEANREKELARRLSSIYQEWDRRPGPDPVPKGLERLKSDVELPRVGGVTETLVQAGQRDQQQLARFYIDRGRRLYEQERDREALAELNRALFLSPYEAEGHLLVGRVHLRAGRLHEAIDAFKISLWSADTAAAHVALAEAYLESKDSAAAETEARRALTLDATASKATEILKRLAGQGR